MATTLSGCDGQRAPWARDGGGEVRAEVRDALAAAPGGPAAFYAGNDYRPIWLKGDRLRPEASTFVDRLAAVPPWAPPLAAERLRLLRQAVGQAASGDPAALARAELALSSALVDFVRARRAPVSRDAVLYVDADLAPVGGDTATLLRTAAEAPSLARHIQSLDRANAIQTALARGWAAYRARWSRLPHVQVAPGPAIGPGDEGARVAQLARRLGVAVAESVPARFETRLQRAVRDFQQAHGLPPTGTADSATVHALNLGPAHYERLIHANLDRASALPVDLGQRYVLVNSATAELYLVEDGRIRDRMRVVVGKAEAPTPMMAARLRFMVLNPYWNLPPDLAARRAVQVTERGTGVIAEERLELLSGWGPDARVLRPEEVDWHAVASGRQKIRMRQLPGADNMMGRVKFMAPNREGIYLHDTPGRAAFALADRRLSAGCVRVEDADRLMRWLMNGDSPDAAGATDLRVDLPSPVPLYIGYFTATPDRGGIVFHDDSYGRDPALLARLGEGAAPRLAIHSAGLD